MATAEACTAPCRQPEPDVITERMTVTPAIARQWLETKNRRNRPVRQHRVDLYGRLMQAGKWNLNGETIAFDRNGDLVNGQHRLRAAVKYDVSFETLVVVGVEPESFATTDRGLNRSGSDDLALKGEQNWSTLQAARLLLWHYRQGRLANPGAKPLPHELDELLDRNPGLRECVSHGWRLRNMFTATQSSLLQFILSERDRDAADRFFADLKTGSGMEPGDPVLKLRDRLIANRTAKAKVTQTELFALTIKAWNLRRDGRKLNGSLQWRSGGDNPEAFPDVK